MEWAVVDGVTVALAMAGAILAGFPLISRSNLPQQEDINARGRNQPDVLVAPGDACPVM